MSVGCLLRRANSYLVDTVNLAGVDTKNLNDANCIREVLVREASRKEFGSGGGGINPNIDVNICSIKAVTQQGTRVIWKHGSVAAGQESIKQNRIFPPWP